jgi:hypothetical protein
MSIIPPIAFHPNIVTAGCSELNSSEDALGAKLARFVTRGVRRLAPIERKSGEGQSCRRQTGPGRLQPMIVGGRCDPHHHHRRDRISVGLSDVGYSTDLDQLGPGDADASGSAVEPV